MKSFDILVQAHTVQNDVTVRRRLIQNDAVVNSRLTACDVIVPKVLTRSMQDYIDVSNGIAIVVGCICDAVMRRLRKLNEVDAMGTLGDIDEMALDEIDYLEQ